MGFSEAVRTCLLTRYADFQGRASRSEFWYFTLFNFIVGLIMNILSAIVGNVPVLGTILSILFFLVGLALICPGIAAAVRRLHDVDKSGWFILLAFIPIVNFYVIYLEVQPSQPASNAYGDNPLQATA